MGMIKPTLLVLLMLLTLTACAVLTQADNARMAVTYATLKVIDDDQSKADTIIELAADVRAHLSGTEEVSVSALDAAVRGQIPWHTLDAADTMLVDTLLIELRRELEQRIGEGLLSQTQRLQVAAVVSWIERAAQMGGS